MKLVRHLNFRSDVFELFEPLSLSSIQVRTQTRVSHLDQLGNVLSSREIYLISELISHPLPSPQTISFDRARISRRPRYKISDDPTADWRIKFAGLANDKHSRTMQPFPPGNCTARRECDFIYRPCVCAVDAISQKRDDANVELSRSPFVPGRECPGKKRI